MQNPAFLPRNLKCRATGALSGSCNYVGCPALGSLRCEPDQAMARRWVDCGRLWGPRWSARGWQHGHGMQSLESRDSTPRFRRSTTQHGLDRAAGCPAARSEYEQMAAETAVEDADRGVEQVLRCAPLDARRGAGAGLLLDDSDAADEGDGMAVLAASTVAGTTPLAGPEWREGALPFDRRPMVFARPLCVALDGFTLRAATRAGARRRGPGGAAEVRHFASASRGRAGAPFGDHEARRVTPGPDGLVRISDGRVAVTWIRSRSSADSQLRCP